MKSKIPDINSLTKQQIKNFALMKKIVYGRFYNVKPEKRKRKKALRFAAAVTGLYDKNDEAQRALFTRGADPDVLYDFLSLCEEKDEELKNLKTEKRKSTLEFLPDEKKRYLDMMTHGPTNEVYLKNDENGTQLVYDCGGYVLIYDLEREIQKRSSVRMILFEDYDVPVVYNEEKGLFMLSFRFRDDDSRTKTVLFSDFDVQFVPVNVCGNYSPDTAKMDPYGYAAVLASYILRKKDLPYDLLNDKEKALIPLCWELHNTVYGGDKREYYPELENIFTIHGAKKAASLLCEIKGETNRKNKKHERLFTLLKSAEYESVWCDIYDKICDSQKDYPNSFDLIIPTRQFDFQKKRMTKKMRSLGYDGEYPEYIKTGEFKKVRSYSARTGNGIVFPAKSVNFYVKCGVFLDEWGNICLEAFSGFAVNGKNDPPVDIMSCMFYGGRAMFKTMGATTEKTLELVTKLAECKKLTKEEKMYVYFRGSFGKTVLSLLIIGLLWSLLFHLLFIPFMFLITRLDGDTSTFMEFIKDLPIVQSFVLAGLSVGGILILLSYFGNKRMR